MFTWICPKCGRDVPPSYSDCPDCTPRPPKVIPPEPAVKAAEPPPPKVTESAQAPAPAIAVESATEPEPAASGDPFGSAPWPPRAAAPPPPPTSYLNFPSSYSAAQPPPVEARKGPPGWLIAIGFAAGLAALLFLLYTYVLPKRSDASAAAGTSAAPGTAAPTAAGAASRKAHPLTKFLEITGVRFTEDAKQRAKVQFIVVNHSAADLPELKMQIAVKAAGKPVFEFPFTISSIGPYESKDFTAPVQTTLKGYELPDWQFLKADFEITSER